MAQTIIEEKAKTEEEIKLEEIAKIRENLPIYKYRDDLLQAIRDHQLIIIMGETRSGKTTQIPQYLHEIG